MVNARIAAGLQERECCRGVSMMPGWVLIVDTYGLGTKVPGSEAQQRPVSDIYLAAIADRDEAVAAVIARCDHRDTPRVAYALDDISVLAHGLREGQVFHASTHEISIGKSPRSADSPS